MEIQGLKPESSNSPWPHHDYVFIILCYLGVVGDWKEHFTEEQKQAFEKIYQEKLSDSNIMHAWTL